MVNAGGDSDELVPDGVMYDRAAVLQIAALRKRVEGILLRKTRVPAFDACRALLAPGITAKLGDWRPGKECPDTQLDIEIGG